MPAVSQKQERFMQAVAHNKAFAKKVGVPQSVGREFTKKEGGTVKESKAMMKKEVSFMKKKGAPKSMIKHEEAEMKGMEAGGISKKMPTPKQMGSLGMKSGGKVKKYAKGGGIEVRGKTKGKMVKMAGGGKYC